MCKEETKWKEIPVSEARAGDEVYHSLYDWWFEVIEYMAGLTYSIRAKDKGTYTSDGRFSISHKFPTLTKARRKVRTVVNEMWGLRNEDSDIVAHVRFTTREDAEKYRDECEFMTLTIPCRVTWEVEDDNDL